MTVTQETIVASATFNNTTIKLTRRVWAAGERVDYVVIAGTFFAGFGRASDACADFGAELAKLLEQAHV